ncbi:MAG: GNAT family N-acetyltransferase [Ignavibacteriales bacterium]
MKVEFRIATESDIEGIIQLCNECFNEKTSLEYAKKMFDKNKNDENTIQIIGVLDNNIIAYVRLAIVPTMFEDMNTYAIINHFCVKDEYRRKNIATSLLKEVNKICLSKGIKSLKLWSKNFRIPAHSCYKKFGFETIDAAFFEREVKEN